MLIGECEIDSKQAINILGIRFEENLIKKSQVEYAIKESNQVSHAIRPTKSYFTLD
jgi:hypothetical protein